MARGAQTVGRGGTQARAAADRLDKWALALALRMQTDVLSRRLWRALDGSSADLLAAALAIFLSSTKASEDHAPVVSATMGTKTNPAASHSASVLACSRFVWEYAVAAARSTQAAEATISGRWGAVMAKSSATGDPCFHEGR